MQHKKEIFIHSERSMYISVNFIYPTYNKALLYNNIHITILWVVQCIQQYIKQYIHAFIILKQLPLNIHH